MSSPLLKSCSLHPLKAPLIRADEVCGSQRHAEGGSRSGFSPADALTGGVSVRHSLTEEEKKKSKASHHYTMMWHFYKVHNHHTTVNTRPTHNQLDYSGLQPQCNPNKQHPLRAGKSLHLIHPPVPRSGQLHQLKPSAITPK